MSASPSGSTSTRATILRTLVSLIVLGGAYVGVCLYLGQQIPSAVRISGVLVGGLSQGQATQTLERALAPLATAPVTLTADGLEAPVTLQPASAGLSLDIEATVEDLMTPSFNPADVWRHLTGRVERDVQVRVDQALLTAALSTIAPSVDQKAKDATVVFTGVTPSATKAVTGRTMDVSATASAVAQAWPDETTVAATVVTVAPKVTTEAAAAAVTTVAKPAVDGPVTLVLADDKAVLAAKTFAPALTVEPDDSGTLVLGTDDKAISEIVTKATADFTVKPRNADIVLKNGRPAIVRGRTGLAVDGADIPEQFVQGVTSDSRRVKLTAKVTKPDITTAQAKALGVKEVVSSFVSYFPYNPNRTQNLIVASRTLNGTLVMPGETFSLNGALGERTTAKGYREASMISGGRLVPAVGGGVSQISTTIYNLSYFAGADLVTHKAHSFYISRYPEGREATVNWPDLDNKFRNQTKYGMLIQMWVADGAVRGRIWSTKLFDVTSVKSGRFNYRAPTSITDDNTPCTPQAPVSGFDVNVTRIVKQNGKVVRRETVTTRYDPENQVTCTNP